MSVWYTFLLSQGSKDGMQSMQSSTWHRLFTESLITKGKYQIKSMVNKSMHRILQ